MLKSKNYSGAGLSLFSTKMQNITEESELFTVCDDNAKSEARVSDISEVPCCNKSTEMVDSISTVATEEIALEHLEVVKKLQNESEFFGCNSLIEAARRVWQSTAQHRQLYTKGCLWAPDGTCLLVPVHLDGMHVIELPIDLYTVDTLSRQRPLSKLPTAVHVKEGGTVYDCTWYPFMNSNEPETCCWLASRQHEPIHMWDAFTGEVRCTYRGYDNVDEIEAAISVAFSNDGQKIYGGYKTSIKIFDTNVPGRDSAMIPVKKAISCFALTTDNDSTLTVGTWQGYINHYDTRAAKLGSLFTLGGHTGGITWLRYACRDVGSWTLFSGARKDNKILEWDMRNYTEPVREFARTVATNQRIYFDLSPQQQWLVSGDTGGLLHIWNLEDKSKSSFLQLHNDCCNGVNIHPTLPILASSSGQHHFVESTLAETTGIREIIVDYENSLILWWCGKQQDADAKTQ